MATIPPASAGLFGALRSLADGVLATVHDRIELFTFDLQEEKLRLVQILAGTGAAVFAGTMCLTFVSLAVVYLFWESARLAVLGGLAAFYAAAFALILVALRRVLTRPPGPFAATLRTLGDDRAWIHPGR